MKTSGKRLPHKPVWKKYQESGKTRQNISLALITLIGIVVLILIAKLISFVASLDEPYASDSEIPVRIYSWDGKSTINLVVTSNVTYLVSFNPIEKSVNVLEIPHDSYMRVPFGFGEWPIQSIYRLGQSEDPPIGAKLLMDTIENELNVPVDGYIFMTEEKSKLSLKQNIEQFRSSLFGVFDMIRSTKTNLSIWEMFTLLQGIRGVRFDKLEYIDLGQITKIQTLPDGRKIHVLDKLRIDPFMKKYFEDTQIRNEGLSIAIVNTTNTFGLAEKASKIVDIIGGRVIFTGSTSDQLEESVVLGKDSYTKTRLLKTFAPKCLNEICEFKNDQLDLSRADVIIVLGQDFQSRVE